MICGVILLLTASEVDISNHNLYTKGKGGAAIAKEIRR